jgi:hypothetical protein
MPRLKFPFERKDIPPNGIYVLFEKGEIAHGTDRIVRIGTHTGEKQLPSRLFQHFMKENKDRSIFRKNIGRALLKKNSDPFLAKWELDLTTTRARERYLASIDIEKQMEVEKVVSKYIQENFTFVTLQVDEKEKRLDLESKTISTVSLCGECRASEHWLGNYSPLEKIRKSGLWLVNELWKKPLTSNDIYDLTQKISRPG